MVAVVLHAEAVPPTAQRAAALPPLLQLPVRGDAGVADLLVAAQLHQLVGDVLLALATVKRPRGRWACSNSTGRPCPKEVGTMDRASNLETMEKSDVRPNPLRAKKEAATFP